MVSPVSPLGGAPSSNSAMWQQSSIVAPQGGSLTASSIARPGIAKGSATLGSRATTAPELIKGTTSFTTVAGTRLVFCMLTSVAYTPGRAPATQQQFVSVCLPQTILTLYAKTSAAAGMGPSFSRSG